MKTLCMDSAHRHLVIVLLEDGGVKAGKALWMTLLLSVVETVPLFHY